MQMDTLQLAMLIQLAEEDHNRHHWFNHLSLRLLQQIFLQIQTEILQTQSSQITSL